MIIKKYAFTLIELMVAITIVVILTMSIYAPYSYYQNKAKLKVTAREISQLLYDTRNMAVNWSIWELWNVSIWVYFDTNILNKSKIKVFSYPHDIDNSNFTYIEWWDVKLINTLILKQGIQIESIGNNDNLLFLFDSISWDIKYYNWLSWSRNTVESDEIPIHFSYKWSTSENLNKIINYFTKTNIIDY